MGSVDAKTPSSIVYLSTEGEWINIKQKHKDELLLTVYRHDGISHSELAKRLQISPSGLNAVLDKICEGGESENGPLTYEKRNKFKYYHLTDGGRKYVEEKLISVRGRECEGELTGYWESFQSKAGYTSDEKLEHFLEQYARAKENSQEKEEQNLVNNFMDCLFAFYSKMPQDALDAVKHLITNEKIQEKIKEILYDKISDRRRMEPLEKMMAENPKEGYRFLDSLWEHIMGGQVESVQEPEGEFDKEAVKDAIHKIESDMLRAIMNFEDAEYLRERWSRNGMSVHLVCHLVEKYRYMLLWHEREREKRKADETCSFRK